MDFHAEKRNQFKNIWQKTSFDIGEINSLSAKNRVHFSSSALGISTKQDLTRFYFTITICCHQVGKCECFFLSGIPRAAI